MQSCLLWLTGWITGWLTDGGQWMVQHYGAALSGVVRMQTLWKDDRWPLEPDENNIHFTYRPMPGLWLSEHQHWS